MQRSTTVNTQDLCGFLKLLLTGLNIIQVFVAVAVVFILVAATGRPVSLPLFGLAAAPSPAGTLLAESLGTILAFSLSRLSYSAFCFSAGSST